MVVINDNRPEESWDTGATYIIPSHQSMHLCGLLSPNQNITLRYIKKNLIWSQSAYHREVLVWFFMGLVDDS